MFKSESERRKKTIANLFNELAFAHLDFFGALKRRHNVAAEHEREALDALKVGVLDSHQAGIGEKLLGIVVDELTIDEDVAAVRNDSFHFCSHLGLLGRFDFGDLGSRLDTDATAKHFDLVRIHWRIGDEHLGVFNSLRLMHARTLVKQEAVVQEGIA